MSDQLPLFTHAAARARRDAAIADPGDIKAQWLATACGVLREFAASHGSTFLAEDFVEWALRYKRLDAPLEPRSWGAVFMRSSRANVLRKVGYAPARTSNLSPKVLWSAGVNAR